MEWCVHYVAGMPLKLPRPRIVLMAMVAFSCVVLVLSYTWGADGPSAWQIESARSQLLADLFVEDEVAPPLCRAQQEQFLLMLSAESASESVADMGCEIELLRTLRQVLDEAELDFVAGRHDAAFSKARALVAHNQIVLGHRSLLTVSVSGSQATKAMSLMQRIAARSLVPELRAKWRRQVEVLRKGQLEDEQLALAIVVGEGRAYLADDTGTVAYGIPQDVADEMTVGYAGLQRDMKYGSSFLPKCLEKIGKVRACAYIQRAGSEQRALRADLFLVAKMLDPRA